MYGKFVKIHFKSMLQYKSNTFILIASSLFTSVAEFLSIYVLFSSFKTIGDWTFYETALTFGMITAIFPFVECFARGYDEFSKHVVGGDLDRMMVRPINIYKQIFFSEVEFFKLPKVLLGVGITIFAIVNLNVCWTFAKVLVFALSVACGCVVIFCVMLVGAAFCFFTIDNLEFVNVITNGGRELCYYPINIYNKWIKRFFTFVIPFACFNYLPLSYILGYGNLPMWLCAVSPLLGMLFLIPCVLFFNWSLKHYSSSGT